MSIAAPPFLRSAGVGRAGLAVRGDGYDLVAGNAAEDPPHRPGTLRVGIGRVMRRTMLLDHLAPAAIGVLVLDSVLELEQSLVHGALPRGRFGARILTAASPASSADGGTGLRPARASP